MIHSTLSQKLGYDLLPKVTALFITIQYVYLEFYADVLLFMFVGFIALVISTVLIILNFIKFFNTTLHLWTLSLVVCMIIVVFSSMPILKWQRENTITDGNIIINALEVFKLENGQYPDSLAQLKPKYLRTIPKTQMGIFRKSDFKYSPPLDYGIPENTTNYYLYFIWVNDLTGVYGYGRSFKEWHYDD